MFESVASISFIVRHAQRQPTVAELRAGLLRRLLLLEAEDKAAHWRAAMEHNETVDIAEDPGSADAGVWPTELQSGGR